MKIALIGFTFRAIDLNFSRHCNIFQSEGKRNQIQETTAPIQIPDTQITNKHSQITNTPNVYLGYFVAG